MPFYLFTTFVLTYVVATHRFSKTFVLYAVLVGAALELLTIPLFSHLSEPVRAQEGVPDRIVSTGLIAFPYFTVLTHGGYALMFIVVVVSFILHALQYGPAGRADRRELPDAPSLRRRRHGLPGASVFAGAPAPLLATSLQPDRHPFRFRATSCLRRSLQWFA